MLKNLMKREDWSEKNVAQKGFTLIELLVVIAILGILAVVGILAFGGLTDSAKTATKTTEKSEVQTAVNAYSATHDGAVPASTAALVPGQLKSAPVCTYNISAGSGDVQQTGGPDGAGCATETAIP